jgi:WD40 repeat protein
MSSIENNLQLPNGIDETSKTLNVQTWDSYDTTSAYSRRSKLFASVHNQGEFRGIGLKDSATGNELKRLKHPHFVSSISFSPDGKRIASGCWDHNVRIWDTKQGKEIMLLKGHSDVVLSVCFSPQDGKLIASASSYTDRTIRLWDSTTGRTLTVLRGHQHPVTSVSFSPNGRWLASADKYTAVRIWDVRPFALFQHDSRPTPLYRTFIEAVKFLWQLDVQNLEIVHKERTIADMKKFGSLLAPPSPGKSKFDQVLEWAETQQASNPTD